MGLLALFGAWLVLSGRYDPFDDREEGEGPETHTFGAWLLLAGLALIVHGQLI